MLEPHNTQEFPRGPIYAKDPVTGHEVNVRPLFYLLYERYAGDKDHLVEALEELDNHLLAEDNEYITAHRLKYLVGIVRGLTTAFDSLTVKGGRRK